MAFVYFAVIMASISTIFSADGLLARAIDGFVPRQAQTDMAEAVRDALKEKHSLIVEAGTGTGKTFAYLAPALTAKGKAIISTGTKNLQEQLYHRDLPLVKKALGSHRKPRCSKAALTICACIAWLSTAEILRCWKRTRSMSCRR